MDFKTYVKKLKDVETKCPIENGYSHVIYQLFDDIEGMNEKYALVDTTNLKRTVAKKTNLFPENIVAIPDFVITDDKFEYGKENDKKEYIYGCIEVKYFDNEVKLTNRLNSENGVIGYLQYYKHVIYTNGWIWMYYDEKEKLMIIDFRDTSSDDDKKFHKLIKKLNEIIKDWN